jgi:hypothetical protein
MMRHHDELRDLEDALQAASQDAAEENFGVRLMRDSLIRRREEIVAEAAGVLEVALRAEGASRTGAEVSLVARVLDSLQESLAAIAQVLYGEPTTRGLIPSAIKQAVQLRIAAAAPGSLQLRLVPANLPDPALTEQVSLLEGIDSEEDQMPLLDQSIERLLGVLTYGSGEREDLLQEIAFLGPRASSHLQALSKALGEGEAAASLSWRSASSQGAALVTTSGATKLARILEEVVESKREVVYTGRLVGGSLVHRTFELELDEDASLVAGKVTEEALPHVQTLFGQRCTAHIEVRQATLPSGETREAHLLTQLNE